MRQIFLPIALLLLLAGQACTYTQQPDTVTQLQRPAVSPVLDSLFAQVQKPALRGTREDVAARERYMSQMLQDPATGRIPAGIMQRSRQYAAQLPSLRAQQQKGDRAALRVQATDWEPKGPFNVGGRTRGIQFDVRNPDIIVAGGVSGGIWRTTDGGANWTKSTDPASLHSVTALVQDKRPGKEDTWYHGSGELVGNTARGGGAPFRGDGIFKSTDGGLVWEQLPSTSAGQRGIFNSQFQYIWNLAIHPDPARDELYAAAFGGIFRSVDEGLSWQVVLGADFTTLPGESDLNDVSAAFYTDVAIASDGVIYATLSGVDGTGSDVAEGGLYRSEDGLNWVEITPRTFPRLFARSVIGISAGHPEQVWFLTDAGGDILLHKYTFSGSGADLNIALEVLSDQVPQLGGQVGDFDTQGSYNLVCAVHPTDQDVVFIGGINLFRSTDGFRSASNVIWIGGYTAPNDLAPYPNHHPDQHGVIFSPNNPDGVLSSHDGGLSFTPNILAGRVTWDDLNNGYFTSQFYTISIDPQESNDLIVGGLQDNGSYLATSSSLFSNWSRLLGGDGAFSAITDNSTYIYVSFQFSEIYRLEVEDGQLRSFARVDPEGGGDNESQDYLFVNPFTLDPNNQNRMYLAGGDLIWRNDNLSQVAYNNVNTTPVNWTRMNNTRIIRGQVSTVSVSRQPADIVYYGTTIGDLYRVDDAASPDAVRTELRNATFPSNGYVSHIAIDPLNAAHIMVVFSNYNVLSLFSSSDGGETFEQVGGNLEEFPDGSGNGLSTRWAQIIPLQDGSRIYLVGTDAGLYSTTELRGPLTVWMQESEEGIGEVVVPMISYRDTDGTVAIATHGNGVYARQYDNVAPLPREAPVPGLSMGTPFPNPFTTAVRIPINIPEAGIARARIYDYTGRVIKTILWSEQFAGESELSWDGTNGNDLPMPTGVYYCRLEWADQTVSRQVILRR